MIVHAEPNDEEWLKITAKLPPEGDELRDNAEFVATYDLETGFYARGKRPANIWWYEDGELKRLKTRMSRREWLEQNYTILDEDKKLVLMRHRTGQRMLECLMLRMERAGVPVRIAVCKSRKHGCSTQIEGLILHNNVRMRNREALVMADTDERAEIVLAMVTTARKHMRKHATAMWDFKMASKAAHRIRWGEPIDSMILIASAQREDPGIGATPVDLHGSEVAVWADAKQKAAALFNSIPARPWTYGIMESTARAAWGLFHDTFWAGWEERDKPFIRRTTSWASLFISWMDHEEYRWTKSYGRGKELPQWLVEEIEGSLDEEERWLLEQTYIRRWQPEDPWAQREDGTWYRVGVGRRKVDYDQLAWRRRKMKDPECQGDINLFNREFPSRPEVAFQSSGNPVFDPTEVQRLSREAKPPVRRLNLVRL